MKAQRTKLFLGIAVLFVIIVFLIIFLKIKNEKTFIKKSQMAVVEMVAISALSESTTEYYAIVWRNAIVGEGTYRRSESPYYQISDFNEAISIAQNELKSSIKTLSDEKSSVETLLKELNSCPNKYKELHSKILSLYGYVSEYISLAISPSGSLQSFAEKRSELSSSILKLSNEIKVQIPKQ
jgi:hypothetical protein